MIKIKLYYDGKNYYTEDKINKCDICGQQQQGTVFLILDFKYNKSRARKSYYYWSCGNCINKTGQIGDEKQILTVINGKAKPGSKPVLIGPAGLKSSQGLSTFDIDSIEKLGGVTIDKTKHSTREYIKRGLLEDQQRVLLDHKDKPIKSVRQLDRLLDDLRGAK